MPFQHSSCSARPVDGLLAEVGNPDEPANDAGSSGQWPLRKQAAQPLRFDYRLLQVNVCDAAFAGVVSKPNPVSKNLVPSRSEIATNRDSGRCRATRDKFSLGLPSSSGYFELFVLRAPH
jgi:hypothetical protein